MGRTESVVGSLYIIRVVCVHIFILLTFGVHALSGVGVVCVCLLSHISHVECFFVLKILSNTQWAMEFKIFVGFSLKFLQLRSSLQRSSTPSIEWPYVQSAIFLQKVHMHIIHACISIQYVLVLRVLHFSAFILHYVCYVIILLTDFFSLCHSLPPGLPPSLFPSLSFPQYIYSRPDQVAVIEGTFVPWCQNCSSRAVEQGLGIVGAVIMPHNLYLHSGLVLVSHTSWKHMCIAYQLKISRETPNQINQICTLHKSIHCVHY